MIDKPRQKSLLPATDSTLGPGDFPVGSIESRAAARAKLEQAKYDPSRYFVVRFMHGDRVTSEQRIEATGAVQPGELIVKIIHVGADAPDMFAGLEQSQHRPDLKPEAHGPATLDELQRAQPDTQEMAGRGGFRPAEAGPAADNVAAAATEREKHFDEQARDDRWRAFIESQRRIVQRRRFMRWYPPRQSA